MCRVCCTADSCCDPRQDTKLPYLHTWFIALHLGGWMSSPLSQPLSFSEPQEEVEPIFGSRPLEKGATLPLSFEKQGAHQASLRTVLPRVSAWSTSARKRIFDCACIVPFLPVLIPVLLAIAIVVRLTSRGPAFFFQKRMGLHGRSFTIFNFGLWNTAKTGFTNRLRLRRIKDSRPSVHFFAVGNSMSYRRY